MSNNEVVSRLEFMGIDDRQRATLRKVEPVVRSLLGRALDRFYDKIRSNPVTAAFFRDGGHITSAKGAQEAHWQRIASGQFDENFYNSVRRIGAVHARIGLETRYYVGGYAHVLEHLILGVQSGCSLWRRALTGFTRPSAAVATTAIVKAALLDMELSLSVYFEEAQTERDKAIAGLEKALNLLADGDLSSDLTEMPVTFRAIEEAYNRTLDKMRGMIGSVSDSATSIRTGSGEIAQASEDLARRTEANAASLEETSAAVVQMDERLRATASAATSTLARADGAIGVVGSGRTLALEAVEAMGRVSESAKGIDRVIEGLDKIAFQTRVLAMNAAVEAGRAGDAGRGFAVVADLVSALAMRSEEEAKSARDQLTVTQSDIITAVDAVKKVDGAFENISSDVGEVHAQLGRIAADNQAQSSTITQISAAVSSMDHATQQNAAMVEETSAASRNLLGEATSLTEHAHQFRLAATDRPKAKAKAAKPRHFVPERKSASRASEAKAYVSPVKPLASPSGSAAQDDWQDF